MLEKLIQRKIALEAQMGRFAFKKSIILDQLKPGKEELEKLEKSEKDLEVLYKDLLNSIKVAQGDGKEGKTPKVEIKETEKSVEKPTEAAEEVVIPPVAKKETAKVIKKPAKKPVKKVKK